MTKTRIYIVRQKQGTARLVRASHPSTALMHVAQQEYSATVATQDDLECQLMLGTKVETVKAEQQQLPAT